MRKESARILFKWSPLLFLYMVVGAFSPHLASDNLVRFQQLKFTKTYLLQTPPKATSSSFGLSP